MEKAVTKNQQKLLDKLAAFVGECETLYGLKITYKKQVKMKQVKKLRKKLYALKESEGIEFVQGSGKRKSELQKSIEVLEAGPQPADTTTLIPFLEDMEEHLSFRHTKVVTDAGYESEENYHYLKGKGQLPYIKPANYEKAKTGYQREVTVYACEDCTGCPHKKECIKGNHSKTPLEKRTKTLYISKKFIRYREEALVRISSKEGRELRMNRSIQAEGSFGDI